MALLRLDPPAWLFATIAVVVIVVWVIVVLNDSEGLTGVNIALAAVVTGAVNLATKPDKSGGPG